MPCLLARPERGRTCASKPSGSSSAKPHGTTAMPPGASTIGLSIAAGRSRPAAPGVAYCGSSTREERRCTRTLTVCTSASYLIGASLWRVGDLADSLLDFDELDRLA